VPVLCAVSRRVRFRVDGRTRASRSRDRSEISREIASPSGAERSAPQDGAARAGRTKEHAGYYYYTIRFSYPPQQTADNLMHMRVTTLQFDFDSTAVRLLNKVH